MKVIVPPQYSHLITGAGSAMSYLWKRNGPRPDGTVHYDDYSANVKFLFSSDSIIYLVDRNPRVPTDKIPYIGHINDLYDANIIDLNLVHQLIRHWDDPMNFPFPTDAYHNAIDAKIDAIPLF